MKTKRITLFTGHYGSGKTNIAVAYAKLLHSEGKKVTVADMDIVNPYFRTKDSVDEFRALGIRFVSSAYANTNVDLPALPSELYGVVENRDSFAVLDIGGDDRGAYALGRFSGFIKDENDYENIFVANMYRPLTRTPREALEVMREIEAAGGLPVTAIVNNSNLGELTDTDTVLASADYAAELSDLSGLPVKFTAARRDVAEALGGLEKGYLPMDLQKKII